MKAAYGTVYISICIHWALSSDECVPFWVSDEWVSLSGSLSGSPFLGPPFWVLPFWVLLYASEGVH
jgi:hypothetical protein